MCSCISQMTFWPSDCDKNRQIKYFSSWNQLLRKLDFHRSIASFSSPKNRGVFCFSRHSQKIYQSKNKHKPIWSQGQAERSENEKSTFAATEILFKKIGLILWCLAAICAAINIPQKQTASISFLTNDVVTNTTQGTNAFTYKLKLRWRYGCTEMCYESLI